MKHKEITQHLVDYCEGALTGELRDEIERHLAECAACRGELALLQTAFEALQHEPGLDVPAHYFTNLIPKIRQRIDAGEKRRIGFALPAWIGSSVRPLAAMLVLGAVAVLFRILGPASTAASPLEELVSQVPPSDVDSLVAYFSDTNDLLHGTETQQRILEVAPNPALVSDHLAGDVFANTTIEPVTYTDPALIDDQVLDLSEDDVSQVLAELDQSQDLNTTTEHP